MRKGIILQSRDVNLLLDCFRFGVLSFSQLRKRHFENSATPTIRNRITQLKKANLLRVTRVGVIFHHGKGNHVGVVYQITRTGIEVLKIKFPQEVFREDPIRLNTLTLTHDLILSDVVEVISRDFPEQIVKIGKHVCHNSESKKRQPDAIIFDNTGKPKVAIELELTGKSERRYREIILQYRLSQEFEKVIYVVGNHAISDKITSQILGSKIVNPLLKRSTEKFYFITLSDLLAGLGGNVKITNGTNEIAI